MIERASADMEFSFDDRKNIDVDWGLLFDRNSVLFILIATTAVQLKSELYEEKE